MAKNIQILSVGDIVTDVFIKLLDDEAHTYVDDKGVKTLAMQFGTKLPFDHTEILEAVGNAANAAVSFSRLGLSTAFETYVGGDQTGRNMIANPEQRRRRPPLRPHQPGQSQQHALRALVQRRANHPYQARGLRLPLAALPAR
ncbi:MAG: hypothetical protein WDN27_05850 [Candidatus Saccharibacteria bacterium]